MAVELGLLPDDGTRFEIQGNLASGGIEDWYTFTATDQFWNTEPDTCDHFNVRVFLSGNPDDQFVIDVRRGGCEEPDQICRNTLNAEWGVNFGGTETGECPCSPAQDNCSGEPHDVGTCMAKWGTMDRCGPCPGQAAPGMHLCTDDSKRFYIRVGVAPGHQVSCEPYRLDISNGAFPWGG
jgi:hypothetical protein